MKKICSLILAALLFTALLAFPALADGSARFRLTGPSSAGIGDTVEVTLNIEGEYEANLMNLSVHFDKDVFSYEGCTLGDAGKQFSNDGGPLTTGLTITGDEVSFAFMIMKVTPSAEGDMIPGTTSAQGEIATLKFKANAPAAEAVFSIEVSEFGFLDLGETISTEIERTSEGISVTVSGGAIVTEAPTTAPTEAPTTAPTTAPTAAPTDAPTAAPTDKPTPEPTDTTKVTDAPDETPAPTDTTKATDAPTAAPDETEPAEETENPAETEQASETEAPAETEQVSETEAPAETEPAEETEAPAETERPDDRGNSKQKTVKTVLIVLGSILGAALLCMAALLICRSVKENKKNN